ncbi:DUF2750 domain-containing protein [Alteromonas genovensis]|uniref:DUF2750 domain-containing protein n=1 Tax=Alteromonas genovensis TaxID=471225 RepID=A0A6N9TKD8_9ALTE|nr:DUF2750 domain-containing protein [Alteromonas genovensis]NDW15989.1 DUF2750 domain-containing protein [Alteromonas genovensis]
MSSLHPMLEKNAFQRLEASIAEIKSQQKLFILKDEHGCVMLTTDEDDGVPVWPDAELALLWATDDWDHCEAMELTTDEFLTKWVPGMTQDNLMVIVCPVPAEEGEVMSPQEFAESL